MLLFQTICQLCLNLPVFLPPPLAISPSYSHFIQPSTASLFSECYQANFMDAVFFDKLNTEEMVEVFTKCCSVSIDSFAPLKPRKAKGKGTTQPWLNNNTCCLRQEFGKAE